MPDEWTITYEADVPDARIPLEPGVEFRLHGERGKRYNFIRLVTNGDGEQWVDCYGGSPTRQSSRSVPIDAIVPTSIKRPKKRE